MIKFTQVGIFDYSYIDQERDALEKVPYQYVIELKSKEENPKPFLEQVDVVHRVACTANSRVWIPYRGNIHGAIGIPLHMFKNSIEREFFPTFASFAIRDTCNKYAPGQYCSKFPNDVVCKDHGSKTGGILIRQEGKYAAAVFGLNLVQAPPTDLIRKDGLTACCLKNHCDKLPTPCEFLEAAGMRIFELYKELYTLQKKVDYCNSSLGVYKKKTFYYEINNPNADPDKDGFLWTRKYPNALLKGYLRGELYEVGNSFFDREYFRADKGDSSEKAADIINERNRKEREEEAKKNK